MEQWFSNWAECLDSSLGPCLAALAVWVFVSGFDDLFVAVAFAYSRLCARRSRPPVSPRRLRAWPEKRIAVFVPLWREDEVIRRMVEHNRNAIRYGCFDFFLGAYPNDAPTLAAVRRLEFRFPNVHLAQCPHDGPTSKADCLNWIYQRMLLHEEAAGVHYDLVVTHDAEDVIHPESFRLINYFSDRYDMVQVPVLPMPTPWWDLIHGVYCDEFAEYQTKDIPARQALGGFLPSNGVGTGYKREALEQLACSSSNRVFEPACLTEDYENGYRLYRLGCRQLFLPPMFFEGTLAATREYFPRDLRAAVRQRTRWVMGIILQGWERHGWAGSWRQRYWWWRDRKGLLGNPFSTLTNIVWLYAFVSGALPPSARVLYPGLLLLQSVFLAFRACACARIYGWRFALGVPLRTVVANGINTVSVFRAVARYLAARLRGEPLVWLKTDHAYPSRAALTALQPPLPELGWDVPAAAGRRA